MFLFGKFLNADILCFYLKAEYVHIKVNWGVGIRLTSSFES